MYEDLKFKSLWEKLLFLLKDTAIYGIAGAFNQFIKIFTVPFVARFYTKEDFGSNDLLNTLLFLTVPFVFFGLDSAIARFYFEYEDEKRKRQLVFFCFSFGIILSIACMLILYTFESQICSVFLNVKEVHDSYQVIIWTVPFLFISSFFTNIFKYNFNRKSYLLQTVGGGFITVLLTFIFVVFFKLPIVWTLIAHLISRILLSVAAFFHATSLMEFSIESVEWKPIMMFAMPFMVTSVLGIWIPSMDRFVLTSYLGVSFVAIYVFGQRITGLLSLPLKSFHTAWGPFSMALYKEESASKTYTKTLQYSTFVLCLFSILIMALQKPLVLVLGSEKYIDATRVIPLLSLFVIIQNLLGILSTGISLSKKSHFFIISYVISIGISYSCMRFLLIPFDIAGVASGLLIGQFFNMLFLDFISKKTYPQLKIQANSSIMLFLITSLFAVIFTLLNYWLWWQQFILGFILAIVMLLFFYNIVLCQDERVAIKNKLRAINIL